MTTTPTQAESGTPRTDAEIYDVGLHTICRFPNGEWSLRLKSNDDESHVRYLDRHEISMLEAVRQEITSSRNKLKHELNALRAKLAAEGVKNDLPQCWQGSNENDGIYKDSGTSPAAEGGELTLPKPVPFPLSDAMQSWVDYAHKAARALAEAGELLRFIADSNVIFPSMCANNLDAYNIVEKLKAYRSRTALKGEGRGG